ncbi:YcaO-like family protein [Streptomyces sp. NPDC050388]|uniref:YcaO-like family protein n=1 Tax=Streptomyces sp. NPDC050388 TaxID=3155781 RepID=UPI0034167288
MSALDLVPTLVGPYGAVVHRPMRMSDTYVPPWWHYQSSTAFVPREQRSRVHRAREEVWGSGRSTDPDLAWRISAIEALERVANYTPRSGVVVSDAVSLPTAIDLDAVPRCSAAERANPKCGLTLPDKRQAIRWVPGVRVETGEPVHLPAVMTCLGFPELPGERFWMAVSTGVAVGVTWESALASGLCEVIERDMVAVTWLQRLRLPHMEPGALTLEGARLVDWCARKFITAHLFDATSEIGVPTVYCVFEAPHDGLAGRVVSAAAGSDLAGAAEHALAEGVTLRMAVRDAARLAPEECEPLMKGAVWHGARENAAAFDFLLTGRAGRPAAPAAAPPDASDSDAARLRSLVARCEQAGHPVYAADITTPELRGIGLHVACAVVPTLQPLTFGRHAQYRGHPRLYRLPALLGHPVAGEKELNSLPQPFA